MEKKNLKNISVGSVLMLEYNDIRQVFIGL